MINKSVPSSPILTIPKMKGQMEGQMEGKRRRDRYCSVDTKNQENCTLMDIDENDSNRKFSYLQMLLKRYYMNNNI